MTKRQPPEAPGAIANELPQVQFELVDVLVNSTGIHRLTELNSLVELLRDQLQQVPPAGYDGNVDRSRFIALQVSIGQYFGSIGCKEIERELFWFAAALHDLDSGAVNAALEPKKNPQGGRVPDQSQTWIARAGVAAAAECFCTLAGLDRKTASRKFIKRKDEILPLLRTGAKIEDAPFNWLREFQDGKIAGPAGGAWKANVETIEAFKNGHNPDVPEWIGLGDKFLDIACKQTSRIARS
jgi:hypothetical protein